MPYAPHFAQCNPGCFRRQIEAPGVLDATSNRTRICACAAVPGHVLVGDQDPRQDKCLEERLSGDRRQGRRPTRRWTNLFYGASAPNDCRRHAWPVTGPKAEIYPKSDNGICEFDIDRAPLRSVSGQVEIAKSRRWMKLPIATSKARCQQ